MQVFGGLYPSSGRVSQLDNSLCRCRSGAAAGDVSMLEDAAAAAGGAPTFGAAAARRDIAAKAAALALLEALLRVGGAALPLAQRAQVGV